VIPAALEGRLRSYAKALHESVPGRVNAIYLVGGSALGDFSERFSNVDLVVVVDGPLEVASDGRLRRDERVLVRAKRDAAIWYTTWAEIADGLGPSHSHGGPGGPGLGGAGLGGGQHGRSDLDTPLTRALLRDDAVPILGPDWPVVHYSEADLRAWCKGALADLASTCASRPMVMRSEVTPLVLQAARLAVGAIAGNVVSKSEAAEAAARLVPHHFRRILADSGGFRKGARTSMYWGPFERKYDARELIKHLRGAADV
jgi:hypothetical protein